MRLWSAEQFQIGDYSKHELYAAIEDTDDWIDAAQSSFVAALPEPFRTESSQVEKTLLFCAVALARHSIALLRRVFGEVD
jgi:hypothetical protein